MNERGYLLITGMLPVAAGFAQPMKTPIGPSLAWRKRKPAVNDDVAAIAAAQAKRDRRAAKVRRDVDAGGYGASDAS